MNQSTIRNKLLISYCCLFFFLLLVRGCNEGFLLQRELLYFESQLDVSTWIIQLSGLPVTMIKHPGAIWFADAVFAVMPFAFLATMLLSPSHRIQRLCWVIWVLGHFVYLNLSYLFGLQAREQLTAMLLLPLIFYPVRDKTFPYLFQAARYFALFVFVSAGVWKIVQGGVFYSGQMTGILQLQHKELLVDGNRELLISVYSYLIHHPALGYCLYLLACLLQLAFAAGFFTRRFDHVLLVMLLLFLSIDIALMRISYLEYLPFGLLLYFSRQVTMPGQQERFKVSEV